jgi:hypothetical protein
MIGTTANGGKKNVNVVKYALISLASPFAFALRSNVHAIITKMSQITTKLPITA